MAAEPQAESARLVSVDTHNIFVSA
jgi:hypothetical protein